MKPTPTDRLNQAWFDKDAELPGFYLAVELSCHDCLVAACKTMGWPVGVLAAKAAEVPEHVRTGGDYYFVIDELVLGAPGDHVRAVIFSLVSGGVVVCEDKFEDLSDSLEATRADAQRVAEKHPGKRVFICEIWPPAAARARLH